MSYYCRFEELADKYQISDTLIANIRAKGYSAPTPIQMQAIPLMLKKREILACAPTGSGKTAAFLVPIIHCLGAPQKKGFRAVIVSPTRELANQTHRECVKLCEGIDLRCHMIDNVKKAAQKFGPKSSQRFGIYKFVSLINCIPFTKIILLISLRYSNYNTKPACFPFVARATSNLVEQVKPKYYFKINFIHNKILTTHFFFKLFSVEWLVVDESDKLFEEGRQGFRDQLGAIYRACESSHIRRAFFSATFAHDVQEWCKLNLDNVVMLNIGPKNAATETVDQKLIFVGSESGKLMAFRNLIVEVCNIHFLLSTFLSSF